MPFARAAYMNLKNEKQLIEKAKYDPLAFGQLYDTYYPLISNYLIHRMSRVDVAADLTSEVFFKAMTKLHTFSWRNISFSSWLYKIANNEIKMYYRKKERKFFSLEFLFEKHHFEPPHTTNIEQEYLAAEDELTKNILLKELQQQLLTLPLIYQEILVLRYFEEKSLEEISEITGKKLNTVKSLLFRGKEKLRLLMNKQNMNK
jgi:RNA polymerase sigma-70 factor (ECF subfamily)